MKNYEQYSTLLAENTYYSGSTTNTDGYIEFFKEYNKLMKDCYKTEGPIEL